jgi:polyhydroxyalkanoate synthase subunit PhaC
MHSPAHEIVTTAEVKRDDWAAATALASSLDRSLHATVARWTGGLSPAALSGAYFDWATHIANAPGKLLQLFGKALHKSGRFGSYVYCYGTEGEKTKPCIEPLPQDRRFVMGDWQKWPLNLIYQSFLLQQQWWHNATTGVRGVSKQHEQMVEFVSRQILDVFAPSNFPLTNPEILARTISCRGFNLLRGALNFIDDCEHAVLGKPPVGAENYVVGDRVAITPGSVVYRNELIELIQYAPTTAKVRPEPILMVPAWIMKYYILDLSPHNSLVRYLTERGFTVFMVSWKNPGSEDRELGLDDYRALGIMSGLDVINAIVANQKIHGVGYCLGGTLLSIAAAAMARDGDDRIATLTLLAAQTDFTEAGELMLFINESQIAFLEDMMWEQGYLDSRQMAGAFEMLRSNDLIWSRLIRDYLLGERRPMTDLMAWNADTTRMPYRMHSEYLRELFLNNDLAEGRLVAAGRPVALTDIRAPIFAVGAESDHVAPWRSTYKISLQTEAEVAYLLTSGGHNAGIVSEPGHRGRSFRVTKMVDDHHYLPPDRFLAEAQRKEGSWWPEWVGWLDERSGAPGSLPSMGAPQAGYPPLISAPGEYVRMA